MSYTCAFDINEITQKVLKVATHQFNENVRLEENVPSPEIQHSDCGPLTCSQIDWQSYLQYPFILWDPVVKIPYLFNTRSFWCPICLEDADKTDRKTPSFLSRTNHWFNGRLKRYNPRLLYHTNSCILLVSCMYRGSRGFVLPSFYIVELSFFISFSNSVLFVSQI